MPSLGDLFGRDSVATQFLLWNVLSQLLGPLLLPVQVELQKLMYKADPGLPIPPEAAAEAVARGLMTAGLGQSSAEESGIGGDVFDVLVKNAQNSPALSAVLELHRRGEIPVGGDDPEQVSVRGALTDQGIRAEWHAQMVKLGETWPTSAEVLNAWLEGQIPEHQARDLLAKAGMPDWWVDPAYNSNGQAPTPTQALELLNRGIIPERGTGPASVSYEQSFLEGPWRNKWLAPFLALAEYLPPPRTVTAMYHQGTLTHARAAELLTKQGLAADLVTAYLAPAATSQTTHDKGLTKTDLTTAYADGILTRNQAHDALVALTYSSHDANTILDLIDVRTTTAQVTSGVARTRTLFQGGKLSEAEARAVLHKLGLDSTQAHDAVATWAITHSTTTKTLTAAEIVAARYYDLIRTSDAIHLLGTLGYDEFDAWIMVAVRLHGPPTDYPRPASPYRPPPPVKVP